MYTEFTPTEVDNKFQTIQEIIKDIIKENKRASGTEYSDKEANDFLNMMMAENQNRVKQLFDENIGKGDYDIAKAIVDQFYEKSIVNADYDQKLNQSDESSPNHIVGETGMNNENKVKRFDDFLNEDRVETAPSEYYIFKDGKETKVSKEEYLNSIYGYESY